MVQFFRFDKTKIQEKGYNVVLGPAAARFFLKRTAYLILFIYSTFFLAVAIPFVQTPFIPIYFIGSLATTIYIARFVNHCIKFLKYRNGSIKISPAGAEIKDSTKTYTIPADDITYMEYNILGNLLIREKNAVTSFPVTLLTDEDRAVLLGSLEDMAPKRTRLYRKVWEFVDAIAVALVLAVHIIQYVVQAYYIPTGSMEDTLLVGDHLFVEKITYGPIIPPMIGMEKPKHLNFLGIRGVNRGDIVIFRPPHEQDKDYIKRCIAISGDKLEIKNGSVYVNGEKKEEPYVKGVTYDENTRSKVQGIVPPGKIVVLGDNRENSMDGRYFGYLDIERIKGRAFVLYWNTEQVKKLDFSLIGLIR